MATKRLSPRNTTSDTSEITTTTPIEVLDPVAE